MRRGKDKAFNIIPFLVITLVLIIISILFYFVFEKSSKINCGILLDKKISKDATDLKLGYGDTVKWVHLPKKIKLADGIAYSVVFKGISVKTITPCRVNTGKILSRDNKTIELSGRLLKLSKDVAYYKIVNGSLIKMYPNNLIVGTSNNKFIESNNEITAILIYPPDITNLKVGISDSSFSTLNHYNLLLHSFEGFIVTYDGASPVRVKNNYLRITYDNGSMKLSSYYKSLSRGSISLQKELPQTTKRLLLTSYAGNPIYFDSLNRVSKNYEYIPKYYGSFEVFIKNKALRLINDVDVENYLRSVVPSEMPTSGGLEGYKTQAVAARTYVLSDMLSGRFAKEGFYVDDTTKSQVYNANPSNTICDSAIEATKSQVLTYNNHIIDAKYYSTSCGVGAPFNEVYYKNSKELEKNSEPYLTFNNFTNLNITSLNNEYEASNFLKDWTIKAYDSNSPYFRWKFNYDINALNVTINKNIYSLYRNSPDSFKKKFIFGIFLKTKISRNGIGKINDLFISKRGSGGNVLEITLSAESGTYRIENETNIKKLFRSKDLEITSLYGNILKDAQDTNITTLPSGFFVIDKEVLNGSIRNVTIYGGGFGHGVGMSQYGVIGLVRAFKSYRDILTTFYKHIKFDDFQKALNVNFK